MDVKAFPLRRGHSSVSDGLGYNDTATSHQLTAAAPLATNERDGTHIYTRSNLSVLVRTLPSIVELVSRVTHEGEYVVHQLGGKLEDAGRHVESIQWGWGGGGGGVEERAVYMMAEYD